jgi:hypothetical protein
VDRLDAAVVAAVATGLTTAAVAVLVLRRGSLARLARVAAAVSMALAGLAAGMAPAAACSSDCPQSYEQTMNAYTYADQQFGCVHLVAKVSSVSGEPFMETHATKELSGNGECVAADPNAKAGYVQVRQNLLYCGWNCTSFTMCNTGPVVYNTAPSHADTGFRWTDPPCGDGYYTESSGAWYFSTADSAWHGGARSPNAAVRVPMMHLDAICNAADGAPAAPAAPASDSPSSPDSLRFPVVC